MNKSEVLSAFNNHLSEFFNDICAIFPDNNDIKVARTSLNAMRLANPRLIISIWKENIVDKYREEIEKGNIEFFIVRNYKEDLSNIEQSNIILEKIDTFRKPVREMGEENQKKSIQYIQNLTKICDLYYVN